MLADCGALGSNTGGRPEIKVVVGDWRPPRLGRYDICHIQRWSVRFIYYQGSQLSTPQDFLLVQGAALGLCPHPVGAAMLDRLNCVKSHSAVEKSL